jgi:predicted small lipoprotein YifL
MIVNSPAGRMLVVAGVIVLALSACGRRGWPEAPPAGAEVTPAQADTARTAPGIVPPVPGASEAEEDLQSLPRVPDRPFILDGIL